MTALLVTHDSSLRHRNPAGHPERPERVSASVDGIRSLGSDVVDLAALPAERAALERIHDADYIDDIHALCVSGGGAIDQDTYAVPASWDAALHAAGAGPTAVDALVRGKADAAFVAVRPPGHHAERRQAMGFCLFNNVAVTAAHIRARGERVAVVDWDVHHGNGTQRSFYRDPDVLYLSLHEFPFYPGTGWVTETGGGEGAGMTVNVPLPGGTANTAYLAAFARIAVPILRAFAPDWILVSAGYDAHVDDPLGGLMLVSDDYRLMAEAVASIVQPGRVIAFLEGGYDLDAVSSGSAATVAGMLAHDGSPVFPDRITGSAGRIVDLAVASLTPFWTLD